MTHSTPTKPRPQLAARRLATPNQVRELLRLSAALVRDVEEGMRLGYRGGPNSWEFEWMREDKKHYELVQRIKELHREMKGNK